MTWKKTEINQKGFTHQKKYKAEILIFSVKWKSYLFRYFKK